MTHPTGPAFARLRRDLVKRRWQRAEPRLRIEIALIAALLGAFAFWQLRLVYLNAQFTHGTHGARAAGMELLGTLAALALLGGAGTGLRMLYRLRREPAGPPWLALPAPAAELLRLQAWEAEMPVRSLAVIAVAAVLAGATLADPLTWVIGVVTFPIAWTGCCRAGLAIATATARNAAGPRAARSTGEARDLEVLTEAWAVRSPAKAADRSRMGTWKRGSPVLAIAAKDLRLALRARAPRAPLLLALALGIASVAVWSVPVPAIRAAAFGLALLAIAACGEWLITLGGCDPFALLRSLPVSPRSIWAARMLYGAAFIIVLVAAHAIASGSASAILRVSLTWLTLIGVAMLSLGVNLQLTLFPQHGPALRIYALTLALAMVCSMAIYLLGWVVLVAAVFHTSRRMSRWWQLEDVA